MDIKGKHVIITGAGSGIGKAISLLLAREGANLVLLEKDEETLKEVQDHIVSNCPECKRCHAIACDIRDEKQVKNAMDTAFENCPQIYALVNNAGILDYGKSYEQDPSAWLDVINTNLYGTFLCSRFILPHMIEKGAGHVINMSSVYGKHASPDSSAYCASKFGIRGFSQSMKEEVKEHNIRVSIVHPSTTKTNLFKGTPFKPNEHALEPEDIAKAVYDLLSMRQEAVVSDIDVVPLKEPYD